MRRFFFLVLTLILTGFAVSVHSQINVDRVLANGRNALYFEDYILSIQYFNQVIRVKPYLPEPYLFRAMAKFNLDDYQGAENDATLCLERNPFLFYAYQCRGAARQSMGNYQGAIEDYQSALKIRQEDRQSLVNLGIAYLQSKNYDESEKTFDLLLKYQPRYSRAYMLRGAMFAEKGDTSRAFTDFEKAIDLDKYYAPSYAQRGLLYLQRSDYQGALEDFNQAIKIDDQNIGFFINRGLARYYLNDFRGAMSDYDQVITRDPQNLVARFNRGLLRAQVGDDNRAIDDFNEVIKQEPDNFMAIYNRAILKEQTGDYRGAQADLNTVLVEYPNFVPGFYYRSEIKRKMGDTKGADRDYWYAYDLEQNLRKEREKGKQVTGKEVLDSGAVADNKDIDKTREKSDKNIEKFNRLVVYDKDEQQQSRYKSELRGRVQDKQVKVDLISQFVITYYEKDEALRKYTHLDRLLEEYNNRMVLKLQLKITNNEAALTDDQAEFHFRSIDDYSLLIEKSEKKLDALFGRALDFMILQDLAEAQADLTRVIDLDSRFAMAYFDRAVVRYKQMELDSYNSGTSESTTGLSLNLQSGKKTVSGIPGAQYATTKIQETNPDTKKMYELDLIIKDYDSVLKMNPDFIYAYFNRGNMRCVQKDFRTAILDYNEAIKREPDFAEAYFNRGLSRLYLGDTQRGIEDLSKAGELGIVDAYNIIKRMSSE